jgi:ankyrin repeat protein
LASGINPNAKNYDLRTPLHLAASEGLYSMAELLLEAGSSVLSKDRYNFNNIYFVVFKTRVMHDPF